MGRTNRGRRESTVQVVACFVRRRIEQQRRRRRRDRDRHRKGGRLRLGPAGCSLDSARDRSLLLPGRHRVPGSCRPTGHGVTARRNRFNSERLLGAAHHTAAGTSGAGRVLSVEVVDSPRRLPVPWVPAVPSMNDPSAHRPPDRVPQASELAHVRSRRRLVEEIPGSTVPGQTTVVSRRFRALSRSRASLAAEKCVLRHQAGALQGRPDGAGSACPGSTACSGSAGRALAVHGSGGTPLLAQKVTIPCRAFREAVVRQHEGAGL